MKNIFAIIFATLAGVSTSLEAFINGELGKNTTALVATFISLVVGTIFFFINICLTGNFEYGTKLDVEKFIVNKGGIIDKTVKKGTDYLIVGGDGNKNWTAENYGNKVKKALEFNKRGGNIVLINEAYILPEPIRGRPGEIAIFLGI